MNLHRAQEILPGLWLGSLRAADDPAFQAERQFSLIVRVHNPRVSLHQDFRRPLAVRQVLSRL
jgi:hypothetical protein